MEATRLILLPFGLGLLGFVEPCSIGSTLIVIKQLEGRGDAEKLAQLMVFAITRALFIGLLGVLAVLFGAAFLGFQRAAWIALGALYVGLGVLYLTGRIEPLMVSIGPSLKRLADLRGSAALGIVFGLNIPACAAPLLFALLAAAAAGGAIGTTMANGFLSLAVFGFSLSLPLIAASSLNPRVTHLIGSLDCRDGSRFGRAFCSPHSAHGPSGLAYSCR